MFVCYFQKLILLVLQLEQETFALLLEFFADRLLVLGIRSLVIELLLCFPQVFFEMLSLFFGCPLLVLGPRQLLCYLLHVDLQGLYFHYLSLHGLDLLLSGFQLADQFCCWVLS